MHMTGRYVTDQQHVLADLARQGSQTPQESSIVVSPGALPGPWAVKIAGHIAYNIYAVQPVVIGDPGTVPVEVGQPAEAVNLAESFVNDGTLTAGTYALMFRLGRKNVFYVIP